jgi:hypothetical protein
MKFEQAYPGTARAKEAKRDSRDLFPHHHKDMTISLLHLAQMCHGAPGNDDGPSSKSSVAFKAFDGTEGSDVRESAGTGDGGDGVHYVRGLGGSRIGCTVLYMLEWPFEEELLRMSCELWIGE